MKTTHSINTTYHLGTIINGAVFIYTGLGSFRTAAKAADHCSEKGAYVFAQSDLVKRGVVYGCTDYQPVARVV